MDVAVFAANGDKPKMVPSDIMRVRGDKPRQIAEKEAGSRLVEFAKRQGNKFRIAPITKKENFEKFCTRYTKCALILHDGTLLSLPNHTR